MSRPRLKDIAVAYLIGPTTLLAAAWLFSLNFYTLAAFVALIAVLILGNTLRSLL